MKKSTSGNELAGLLVINKAAGMTSRDVVNQVQRITGIKKCGHAGTLDPLATGVLVVCLGRATRLVPYVQQLPKCYLAGFRLGWRSNTDDIAGELQEQCDPAFPTPQQLTSAMQAMTGAIAQLPPQFSAKKVAGRRAYAVARQGETVELTPQTVFIESQELLEYAPPDWTARIVCGSGTYIRSIGRDLGEQFGCGAIMTSLVREAIGGFTLEKSVTLEELSAGDWTAALRPLVEAVQHLPCYRGTEAECRSVLHGRSISGEHFPVGECVAILDEQGELLALASQPAPELLKPEQVFAAPVSPGNNATSKA